MIYVEKERDEDIKKIHALHCLVFETDAEAELVDGLRREEQLLLSLVAKEDETIIGHVAFSEVIIKNRFKECTAAALAPMAVLEEYQNQGIGRRLIETGFTELLEKDVRVVVVLGHPDYYPKFGFTPSSRFDIDCEYDVPPEAFMVKELESGALECVGGKVYYSELFRKL